MNAMGPAVLAEGLMKYYNGREGTTMPSGRGHTTRPSLW